MSITSLKEFSAKRSEKQILEEKEIEQFTMDAWSAAVDNSRYLPWQMAVKLIQQIMIDHGIKTEDIKSMGPLRFE